MLEWWARALVQAEFGASNPRWPLSAADFLCYDGCVAWCTLTLSNLLRRTARPNSCLLALRCVSKAEVTFVYQHRFCRLVWLLFLTLNSESPGFKHRASSTDWDYSWCCSVPPCKNAGRNSNYATVASIHIYYNSLCSTLSPIVTLLCRRAQSGRWSSFGKRVWFTESHIVLIIVFLLTFYLFILYLK